MSVPGWTLLPVRTVCTDEVVDCIVSVDRLSRVAPEAIDHVVLHQALLDEVVVHVRYLQLATGGRRQGGDDVEHACIIEVDTGNRIGTRWVVRFFNDASQATAVVELGYPHVAQMTGLTQAREKDPGTPLLRT